MTVVLPFNLPAQQLPQPTDRLSDEFLHALPAPVGLWMPSKLAQAAADFTPLPQKHFGAINGGVATTPGGFGVLGAAWKLSGTATGYASFPGVTAPNPALPFSVILLLKYTTSSNLVIFEKNGNSGFSVQCGAAYSAGRLSLWVGGSGDGPQTSHAWNDGNWHVAVLVADATNPKAYIDGADDSTTMLGAGTPSYGSNTPIYLGGRAGTFNFLGSVGLASIVNGAMTLAQAASLYQALLTGEPYPLFQPQTAAMTMGSAAGPASASGAGALVATNSLIASSLYSAVAGIATSLSTIASSLQSAAAGIQAIANQSVTNNLASGSASIQGASLEEVLTNLAAGAAAVNGSSVEQVLSNIASATAIVGGSSAEVASSLISALGALQALSSQTTAVVAQGIAQVAATGNPVVLTNLAQLQETLTSVATFTASSIYQASMSLSDSAQAQVVLALLSVAEQIEALSAQLTSSIEQPKSSGGASATVIASNLYAAASRLTSSVSVSIGGLQPGDVDAIYYLPKRLKTFYLPPRTGVYYLPQRSRVYYLPQSRNN